MSEVHHFVHQPGSILRRHVREILWLRSERPRTQVLLPETALTMALRQSGSASLLDQALPVAVVSGLQQRSRTVEHAARSSLVVMHIAKTHPGLHYGARVEVREWTSPTPQAAPTP